MFSLEAGPVILINSIQRTYCNR